MDQLSDIMDRTVKEVKFFVEEMQSEQKKYVKDIPQQFNLLHEKLYEKMKAKANERILHKKEKATQSRRGIKRCSSRGKNPSLSEDVTKQRSPSDRPEEVNCADNLQDDQKETHNTITVSANSECLLKVPVVKTICELPDVPETNKCNSESFKDKNEEKINAAVQNDEPTQKKNSSHKSRSADNISVMSFSNVSSSTMCVEVKESCPQNDLIIKANTNTQVTRQLISNKVVCLTEMQDGNIKQSSGKARTRTKTLRKNPTEKNMPNVPAILPLKVTTTENKENTNIKENICKNFANLLISPPAKKFCSPGIVRITRSKLRKIMDKENKKDEEQTVQKIGCFNQNLKLMGKVNTGCCRKPFSTCTANIQCINSHDHNEALRKKNLILEMKSNNAKKTRMGKKLVSGKRPNEILKTWNTNVDKNKNEHKNLVVQSFIVSDNTSKKMETVKKLTTVQEEVSVDTERNVVESYNITLCPEDRPLLPPKTEEDYGISDVESGTDEETPRKMRPNWARKGNYEKSLHAQTVYVPSEFSLSWMKNHSKPDMKKLFEKC